MGRPKARPRRPKSYPTTSARRSYVLSSAMEMSPQQMMAEVPSYTFSDLKADSVEKVHKWIDQIVDVIMSARLSVSKSSTGLRKSTLALHRMKSKDHEGFEEVRLFVKQGSEFSKELVQTLTERAELENTYARGLQKLSAKLFRATKDLSSGTISNAWHFVAEDMEATADTHRSIAATLSDELVRPLKSFVESQHKSRKSVESIVDKRSRSLTEWRGEESKAKIKCYSSCRENERVQDQALDCKLGRGCVLSDKENVKLETKRKKSEETVRKSDLDYYACCLKAERARLEWESAVLRGTTIFRRMEEDRLRQLQHLAELYQQSMMDQRPKLVAASQRLQEPIEQCDVIADMEAVRRRVEIDQDSLGDQFLPYFYAEDQMNAMNQERRREALVKFLRVVKADIDREKKGKAGVENLARALQETPKFGSEDSQQDVQEKLQHMRSMLTFLESCRLKLVNSLLELEGKKRICHPLTSSIEYGRDKNGMSTAVLRVPYWKRQEPVMQTDFPEESALERTVERNTLATVPFNNNMLMTSDFTTTVLVNGHPDVDSDFDEFSDGEAPASSCNSSSSSTSSSHNDSSRQNSTSSVGVAMSYNGSSSVPITTCVGASYSSGSSSGFVSSPVGTAPPSAIGMPNDEEGERDIGEIYYNAKATKQVPSIGTCRALYDYSANMYDELSIRAGDVINIHDKQDDGWWLGELNGTVGIFPATYVEEN